MTADMILRRKSDGLILSSMIVDWSGWFPDYVSVNHKTQMGTYYPQTLGYANEMQEITCLFASHYPNSTPERFKALWQAHRRNHTLTFRDSEGVTRDVRVFEMPDMGERWKEVPAKTIVKRKFVLISLGWTV